MGLKRTWRKLRRHLVGTAKYGIVPLPRRAIRNADAIVTTNEVTDRHGTGVILDRIFGASPQILSLRSTNLYSEHALGAEQICLSHEGLSRAESYERLLYALNGSTVRRILCVPFLRDEVLSALVLNELFEAPLCTFLMDDNNIFSDGIPDELMQQVLARSRLRLAISPEMRDAYEKKYGLKCWVVPPVVKPEAIRTKPQAAEGPNVTARTGVLVGSIWGRGWFEQLRETLRGSGLQLHWYGNAPWLKQSDEQLRQDGIIHCGFVPEKELTRRLKEYPFAVIPSGSLDERDDRPEIARLSLPTRLPYLLAAANLPMIVLGSPQTGAARFLRRFQAGRVCPYEPTQLNKTVEEVCRPETQQELRRKAAEQAPLFSAQGLADWIWGSLEKGEPVDDRFEAAFRRSSDDIVPYIDPPAPGDLRGDDVLVHQALRRLRDQGFAPDFVVDVGSSTGVWSDVASRVFPRARFVLIDPLHAQHARMNDWFFRKHPEFEPMAVAISDRAGEAEFGVSADLYGSSLLFSREFRSYELAKVPVRTLDQVAAEKKLSGRGLLKLDVQFAEHLALAGARELLPQVDALVVELSLARYAGQTMLFPEMCALIRGLGFRYYEDVGGWRSPLDGTLLQKDVLFVREDRFPYDNRTGGTAAESVTDAASAGSGGGPGHEPTITDSARLAAPAPAG